MVSPANWCDDVLLALVQIDHRRARHAGIEVGFPDRLAGRLVQRSKLRVECEVRPGRAPAGPACPPPDPEISGTIGGTRVTSSVVAAAAALALVGMLSTQIQSQSQTPRPPSPN